MFSKSISVIVLVAFVCSMVTPVPKAHAADLLGLPEPGAMVSLSPAYSPAILKGVTVHKDNPFMFDFIVDVGQDKLQGEALKQEGQKLIKYFLASLAIPEKDLWVNLSPYEKDRTIPQALSQTEMGRDLLAQDYILKQLTASLIYPEKQLGKTFWDKVYSKTRELYGPNAQVPVNTFNKVWIMADRAEVFERNNSAFVVDSHLKVMLEEDYLALTQNNKTNLSTKNSSASSKIIREVILPELEKEVNTGKNFAPLRQIFNSLILASWYKNSLKNALLNQVYSDKSTVKGINLQNPNVKEEIYQRYLSAYKKGVFNFIKEDTSQGKTIPRKYFSGGVDAAMAAHPRVTNNAALLAAAIPADSAMVSFQTGFDLKDITSTLAVWLSNVPSAEYVNRIVELAQKKPGLTLAVLAVSAIGLGALLAAWASRTGEKRRQARADADRILALGEGEQRQSAPAFVLATDVKGLLEQYKQASNPAQKGLVRKALIDMLKALGSDREAAGSFFKPFWSNLNKWEKVRVVEDLDSAFPSATLAEEHAQATSTGHPFLSTSALTIVEDGKGPYVFASVETMENSMTPDDIAREFKAVVSVRHMVPGQGFIVIASSDKIPAEELLVLSFLDQEQKQIFVGNLGERPEARHDAPPTVPGQGDKALVALDPKLAAAFPELFKVKDINGRQLDPLKVIEALTQAVGSDIPKALNDRRLLLGSQMPAREKYAFPKFTDTFTDGQGNTLTFGEIVQGMLDNFNDVDSKLRWRLNEGVDIPSDINPLAKPGLQVTGPSDPINMAINQLNALLSVRMPDTEDAAAAWFVPAGAPADQTARVFAGLDNERILLSGEGEGKTYKKGEKEYQLTQAKAERPTTIERIPSIHLLDKHITINGKPTPAIAVALVLHFLNTYGALKQNGSGNYYYVPKVQTPAEALIVERLLMKLEELSGLKLGTIKIEILYEEGNAGRWLPVIMWIFRHRLIGSNVGRWDYIGSLIEMWKDEGVFPDPQGVGMASPNLVAYQRYNALLNLMAGMKNGDQTNGAPIGGMAAVMLYPTTDPYQRYKNNPKALRLMKIDKLRERLIGLILVPEENLGEGVQPALEDILSGKVKGRIYDTYRQSWVATTDKDYVAAGNSPLRTALAELQALLDAPEEWVTIDGKKVPTVASGLTAAERTMFTTLKLLNADGKISPWTISKEKFSKPEDLFNDQLWNDLYAIPKGDITIERVQHAYYMGAQYGFQILNGNYAAAIDDYELGLRFMNDLATYRIFVGWLWTAFHHKAKVTKDGFIKDPEVVADRGVVPNKNVNEVKAGTPLTPEIFDQVWAAHGEWTKTFFAEQERRGVTSAFDTRWADVIMDVLKRQLLSDRYLQHSPRVLFVIAEAAPELRKQILDAIFDLTREEAVRQVTAGTLSRQALEARDYVFDYYEPAAQTDAAMMGKAANPWGDFVQTVQSKGLRPLWVILASGVTLAGITGYVSFDQNRRIYEGTRQEIEERQQIVLQKGSPLAAAPGVVIWDKKSINEKFIVYGRTSLDMTPLDIGRRFRIFDLKIEVFDPDRDRTWREVVSQGTIKGNFRIITADEKGLNSFIEAVKNHKLADPAMKVSESDKTRFESDYGGIDLNANNINWKVRKDGKGVEMDIDPAMIERIRSVGIESLTPVIFRVTPVVSVWPLVGMKEPKKEERLAGV